MIPIMDDPLSRHWDQPSDIREAPMDDKTVLLTKRQLDALPEYSRSIPTGVYPGKCWKRHWDAWVLCWYGEETTDHKCPVCSRNIEVV